MWMLLRVIKLQLHQRGHVFSHSIWALVASTYCVLRRFGLGVVNETADEHYALNIGFEIPNGRAHLGKFRSHRVKRIGIGYIFRDGRGDRRCPTAARENISIFFSLKRTHLRGNVQT